MLGKEQLIEEGFLGYDGFQIPKLDIELIQLH